MKKKETGVERILGRKLARELRGDELARATGTLEGGPGQQVPLKPIKTLSASQPPDTIVDGNGSTIQGPPLAGPNANWQHGQCRVSGQEGPVPRRRYDE